MPEATLADAARVAEEPQPTPPEAAAKRPRKRRRTAVRHRVVWVDDDVSVVSASARRLRRRGVKVIPASDGMQGYWLALTHKPDVIVTDLRMPRWEGRDLLECLAMNDETRGIPVVVLSGHVDATERERLTRMGVAAVLEKPVDWAQLRGALKDVLG